MKDLRHYTGSITERSFIKEDGCMTMKDFEEALKEAYLLGAQHENGKENTNYSPFQLKQKRAAAIIFEKLKMAYLDGIIETQNENFQYYSIESPKQNDNGTDKKAESNLIESLDLDFKIID